MFLIRSGSNNVFFFKLTELGLSFIFKKVKCLGKKGRWGSGGEGGGGSRPCAP